MTFVIVRGLNQFRPMWYFVLSFTLFLLGQLAYFLLGKLICDVRDENVASPWKNGF
jgi:hypothetical protein